MLAGVPGRAVSRLRVRLLGVVQAGKDFLTGHSRRGALCGFQRGQGVRPSLLPDDLRGAVGVLAV